MDEYKKFGRLETKPSLLKPKNVKTYKDRFTKFPAVLTSDAGPSSRNPTPPPTPTTPLYVFNDYWENDYA